MLATYHNHSRWSDGQATIPELIAAAASQGVSELGISDHWLRHPFAGQQSWAMPSDRLGEYVSEILSLREQAKAQFGIALRLGLEVDWFVGCAQSLQQELNQFPFDYLIGSVHEVQAPGLGQPDGRFVIDMTPESWKRIGADQRDLMHREYWLKMKSLAESGVYDIVAHIDLPKKFGYRATIDLTRDIGEALDAIAAARTPAGGRLAVEVNTSGWHKPCREAYPAPELVGECRRRDIPMLINADAHQAAHLTRDFDRALAMLADAGYQQVARFAGRQMRLEPLGLAHSQRA